ncbi:MAG: SDR family NAD(P)-dependent oxidoreductase [Pseudomonadota bacterium]
MQAHTPWTALYPADKSWDTPLAPGFIADGLEAAARRWPDAIALASDQATFTFAQLHARCVRVARGLQDIGVGEGTHVALLLKNTPSHVVCFYAVLLAGGRVVNLSASTAPAQLREQLEDARAEVLVTGAPLRALLAPAGARALRCVVCEETEADFAEDPAAHVPAEGDVTLAQLAANRSALRVPVRASALEEVAVLQYTGGTTGAPKAAMLTHANFSAIPHAMRLWAGDAVGAGRVLLVVLPLSHVFGLALMCLAVANGLKMVLRAGFDTDRTLQDVGGGEVSLFFGVPMMYAALAANPRTRRTDWSRVRVCGSGGAPLALETFDAFREATGREILEGYSLTEIADLGTWQLVGRPAVRGKVGIPFPLTVVEIVDLDTGETVLPPGETGEVCFRGPQLMRGYWNRPEETAHAMRGGRFHTGDVGRLDEHGYLALVDRMKDMLIVAGHKVFSRRVEDAVAEHPAIAEACVFGMPSVQAGQLPKAVVTLRDGQVAPTLAQLQEFLRERLGRYELPMALEVMGELPRTAAGKVAKALLAEGTPPAAVDAQPETGAQPLPAALARAICALFAESGQFAAAQLTPQARLESYGMDSLTVIAVHARLAQPFPELPSTVFYEFATIAQLAAHIADSFPEAAARWLGRDASEAACIAPSRTATPARRSAGSADDDGHAIAIIGLSGRYAKARTLDAYWDNLKSGRDCISEIPPERWLLEDSYVADPSEAIARGKSYCKWLGYLEGFADFDPLFFGISPRDALTMDPQERLFVQSCWEALEDAAYTRDTLARVYAGSVGVFAGITNMGYDLYGPDLWARGHRLFPYTWFSSLANRVSYLLDLHGPSMPVDTMCSSSLTAIHEACQHIRRGECELALAGGVNLYVHPAVHAVLCMRRMLSVDGRSKSFGAGANGYAPGEGAGVVVLKRLSRAVADGDHIHAVIRGSAINHGGRTNGYTVPSPAAQRALIRAALADAGVNARAVSYLEAHGTGTELGDPIEIAGLHQAFSADTGERGFCAIGSVKSNVGHCESAAGMAGLTKLILQMRHGQLVPSLHAETLNPRIDFEPTAFRLQRTLAEWPRPRMEVDGEVREMPRIAGISSFGAGGSNAHVVLEEYVAPEIAPDNEDQQVLIVLSAPNRADLRTRAQQLEAALAAPDAAGMRLADVAYTLQVGREPMRCRLAFVTAHFDDLRECLANFARDDHAVPGVWVRELEAGATMGAAAPQEPPPELEAWLRAGDLDKLAEAWAAGSEVDWDRLPRAACRRMSLPAYRFGGERYWVADILKSGDAKAAPIAQAEGLHPLVHRNTSRFGQQRFSSRFDGREFFLRDHKLQGRALLPAMALPETVRVALVQSAEADAGGDSTLMLQDVAWLRPFVVDGAPAVLHVELGAASDGMVPFALVGDGAARETFARGRARLGGTQGVAALDLAALRARCTETIPVNEAYAVFRANGLEYGPAFHVLQGLEAGADADGGVFALGRLALPADAARTDALELHPALLDGAIQTAAGLSLGQAGRDAGIGFTMPFALQSLEMLRPLPAEGVVAVVRRAAGASAAPGMSFLDMDLAGADGTVHVRIRGLAGRSPGAKAQPIAQAEPTAQAVLFRPRREALVLPPPAGIIAREHLVAYASLEAMDTGRDAPQAVIARAFPSARSIDLRAEAGGEVPPFERQAARLFALLKELAQAGKPVLLQVVAPAEGVDATLAGLQGLLASAALESPQVTAQLLQVEAHTSVPQTVDAMRRFAVAGSGAIRVAGDTLSVERFAEEVPNAPHAPAARPWRDGAVYFISGGAGAIGLLFAEDIALHARDAAVVLTSRRAPSPEQARHMDALRALGLRVLHLCMDVADAAAVRRAVAETLARFGRLDGVLHAAGVVRDNLLARKSAAEFDEVLAPKVAGARHLDEATRELPLAFFACFSSTAALGNVGQADYAAANAFLDAYAGHRNALAAKGLCHGRTLSVNWPLWAAGGMTVGAAALARMNKEWGVVPLPSANAMEAFAHALAGGAERMVVTYGEPGKLRRALAAAGAVAVARDVPVAQASAAATPAASSAGVADPADPALLRRTEELLRQVLAKTAALEPDRIEAEASFDNYGIDSILIMDMTEDLEKTLGPLSKTLFFEYPSIARLARRLAESHGARLAAAFGMDRGAAVPPAPVPVAAPAPTPAPIAAPAAAPPPHGEPPGSLAIAVIGVAGRYPGAEDIAQFWDNLRAGKDSVTEIPPSRWDHSRYFDAERGTPGTTYGKWGGFIEDVHCFDPLFFNIAPREAEIMDPQERLFLQCTYSALEDAGYTRDMLGDRADAARARRVGVFVGVMSTEFQLFGAQEQVRGNNVALTGSAASIANRVSYFLDVSGPSMAVDTMCSSSLTAIELACQSIRYGRCKMAIAGGVNLTLHPNKYLMLAQGRFISSTGQCASFGQGGDGYVPGEGVGALVLKPLEAAVADGDQVYGVILATATNHGGKANGYTVPNPNAQAAVIADCLDAAGVDARALSYLEAHGTGTTLGDPIEIAGLARAFSAHTQDRQFCAIGSVKSNIGHCEGAAGVAGVTKVLLQLRHGMLAPSLHSATLNPNIDFAGTPFTVQRSLAPWPAPAHADGAQPPRVAGVSSFGAGGSNAHVILREHREPALVEETADGPVVIVLSARDREGLDRRCADLLALLQGTSAPPLAAMAYTLQTGREEMPCRLAFVAATLDEVRARLAVAAMPGDVEGIERADLRGARRKDLLLHDEDDFALLVEGWIAKRKHDKLAAAWVRGHAIPWRRLYGVRAPRRVSLPAYPFARIAHAIPQVGSKAVVPAAVVVPTEVEAGATLAMVPRWETVTDLPGARWPEAASQVVLVHTADACIEVPPGWGPGVRRIALQAEDTVESVAARLGGEAAFEHLVWVVPPAVCDAVSGVAGVADDQFAVIAQGLRLVKALDALGYAGRKLGLTVLTFDAQALSADELVDAAAAGVHGFVGSLAKERTRWAIRLVDVQDGALPAFDDVLCIPVNAAGNAAVHRAGRWHRQVLLAHGDLPTGAPGLVPGGVYIVIGGAGGLGRAFSAHLVRSVRGQPVWVGRRPRDEDIAAGLREIGALGVEPLYLSADASVPAQLQEVRQRVLAEFGRIDGVVLTAMGATDKALQDTDEAHLRRVLAPKLDVPVAAGAAFGDLALRHWILFSSNNAFGKGAGNAGYSAGCTFLDAFAHQLRQRTASAVKLMHWGYWGEVGVGRALPDSFKKRMALAGIGILKAPEAMAALDALLRAPFHEMVFQRNTKPEATDHLGCFRAGETASVAPPVPADDAPAGVADILTARLAAVLKIDAKEIDGVTGFAEFGIDSISSAEFADAVNAALGTELQPVDILSHPSIGELSAHVQATRPSLAVPAPPEARAAPAAPAAAPALIAAPAPATDDDEAIAIIGLQGVHPGAADLAAHWRNLAAGTDCIGEIDAAWLADDLFHPDPATAVASGRNYCRWGGRLDPLWAAGFDAGLIPAAMAFGELHPVEAMFLRGIQELVRESGHAAWSVERRDAARMGLFICGSGGPLAGQGASADWSGGLRANRISFMFDLRGPSMAVDTMSSSSLAAVHAACASLRRGECRSAIAGSFSILGPDYYRQASALRFLGSRDDSRSFTAGDGYLPAECAGAVLLKTLRHAREDGDRVLAVLRSTVSSYAGRESAPFLPSPRAQARLVEMSLKAAGVEPRAIGHVESAANGAALGDAVEFAALCKVFGAVGGGSGRAAWCALGSVKANIGHAAAASGISQLAKVVLQLRHRTLVPTPLPGPLNPGIRLEGSPFAMPREAVEWECPIVTLDGVRTVLPRRALLNSFGAGGSYLGAVVEEGDA